MEYLQDVTILKEEKIDKALNMRVLRFIMIQGKLYKKSMAVPYLRWLEDHEAT